MSANDGHPGWPVTLVHREIELRPLKFSDYPAWREVRDRNEQWLKSWEPTSPMEWPARHTLGAFLTMRSQLRRAGVDGYMMPFVMVVGGDLTGQVNVGPINRGVVQSADIGYWIDERKAGRGYTPRGVALAVRHALTDGRLHRVAAVVRPENAASLRVMDKLGMRHEGTFQRYLDIDGAWRDHEAFAMTAEDDRSTLDALLG